MPAGTVEIYKTSQGWSEYKDHICEKVQFKDLKANGESEKETTTELTLVFDQDIKGLTLDDITLKGGAKVKLIQDKESGVYKLKIKDISVKNNEEVNVKVQKDGYCINPNDKDVGVYVKKHPLMTQNHQTTRNPILVKKAAKMLKLVLSIRKQALTAQCLY